MATQKLECPAFTSDDIELYLVLLERYFAQLNIADNTHKYNTILCNLPQDVLSQIRALILDPPARNRYEAVCNALRNIYLGSSVKRMKTLMTDVKCQPNSDHNIRVLWNSIQKTVPALPLEMAKDLFISKLPNYLQVHALTNPTLSIQQLIELLQNVESLTGAHPESTSTPPIQINPQLTELSTSIQQLTRMLNSTTPTATSSTNTSETPSTRTKDKHNCYYHNRFGVHAKKCVPPCRFTSSKNE